MASRKPSENPNGQSPIEAQDLNQKVSTGRTQTESPRRSHCKADVKCTAST